MAEVREGLHYTQDHEWVKIEGSLATVGIDDFAQHQLTDIVFVELPAVGKKVKQKEVLAAVESIKSVSDVFAPVSGEVAEVNADVGKKAEMVNQDPYGKGWMVKLRVDENQAREELKSLLDAEAYRKFLEGKG